MGFKINTNIGAMNAHAYATMTNSRLDKNLTSLSSGLRITKAADDAAGMSIADSLRSQQKGLDQAVRNANEGISVLQIADGALDEFINILTIAKQKAIQSRNDTNSTASRMALHADVTKLLEEAQNIAQTTSFNNMKLLDGGFSAKSFQIGAYAGETFSASIGVTTLGSVGTDNIDLTATTVSTAAGASAAIASMESAIISLDKTRSAIGSYQNKLESTIRNLQITNVNVAAAESQIRDVDFAKESADFNRNNILAQSGSYALSQANAVQQNVLRLLQ